MAGETGSEAGYGNGNSTARYRAHRRGTQLYAALTADLKSHAIVPSRKRSKIYSCRRAPLRRIEAIELG